MTQQYSQSDQYFDRSIVPFIRHARSPSTENVIDQGVQHLKQKMTTEPNKQFIKSLQSGPDQRDNAFDLTERPVNLRKYSSDEEAASPMDEHDRHSQTDSGSLDDSASTFSDVASICESLLSLADYSDEEDCAIVEVVEFVTAGRAKVISVPASPVTFEFANKPYEPLFDDDDQLARHEDRLSLEEDCFIWPTIPPRQSSRGHLMITTDHRYATVYRPLVPSPTTAPPNRYYGYELPRLSSNEPRSRSSLIKSMPYKEPRASPSLSSLHSTTPSSIKLSRKPSLRAKFAPSFLHRLSRVSDSERSSSIEIDPHDSVFEIPATSEGPASRPKMIARGASEREPAYNPTKYDAILEWDEGTEYPLRTSSISSRKTSNERKRKSVGSMLSMVR